jgi:hypothetical protein
MNRLVPLLVIIFLIGSAYAPVEAQATCTQDSQCPSGQTCSLISGTGVCSGNLNGGTGAGATNGGTGAGSLNGGTGAGATNGGTGAGAGGTLQNPLKFNDFPTLLKAVLGAVVYIGAILLTLMLVWCGFLFVMARGNPEELSKARSTLMWTLIGGLILLGAQAISDVVQATAQSLS